MTCDTSLGSSSSKDSAWRAEALARFKFSSAVFGSQYAELVISIWTEVLSSSGVGDLDLKQLKVPFMKRGIVTWGW